MENPPRPIVLMISKSARRGNLWRVVDDDFLQKGGANFGRCPAEKGTVYGFKVELRDVGKRSNNWSKGALRQCEPVISCFSAITKFDSQQFSGSIWSETVHELTFDMVEYLANSLRIILRPWKYERPIKVW